MNMVIVAGGESAQSALWAAVIQKQPPAEARTRRK